VRERERERAVFTGALKRSNSWFRLTEADSPPVSLVYEALSY